MNFNEQGGVRALPGTVLCTHVLRLKAAFCGGEAFPASVMLASSFVTKKKHQDPRSHTVTVKSFTKSS